MSEKPNRKFWRFHLLTLVTASLSIGVLLMLNLSVRQHFTFGSENVVLREHFFGWPVIACDHHRQWHTVIRNSVSLDEEEVLDEDAYFLDWPLSSAAAQITTYFEPEGISPWWKSPFLIDVFSSGAIMVVVVAVSELLIRRREARKT
jgi:hypothetical protein